jgi:hypothetical protein
MKNIGNIVVNIITNQNKIKVVSETSEVSGHQSREVEGGRKV